MILREIRPFMEVFFVDPFGCGSFAQGTWWKSFCKRPKKVVLFCKSCNLCLLSFLGLPTSWIIFPLFSFKSFLRCLRRECMQSFTTLQGVVETVSHMLVLTIPSHFVASSDTTRPQFPFLLLQDEKLKLLVLHSVFNYFFTFCFFNWQRPEFPNLLLQIVIVTFTKLVGYFP